MGLAQPGGARPDVMKPRATAPTVLQAQHVTVARAPRASTAPAPPDTEATAEAVSVSSPPPPPQDPYQSGCTTVLVRKEGGYIMKLVKDEDCPGCDVCQRRGQ